jgi:hypothetical protein
MSRLEGVLTDTFTGALIGALGGALCGVLFGSLCWAAFGRVSAVWVSGAYFLRACAAAGTVAGLSFRWIASEPLGWREFLPRRETGPVKPAHAQSPYAFLAGGDLVLRTTGQAMRIPGAPPAGSANGQVTITPPETRLR